MHTARKVSLQEWKYVPVSESRECQTALLALRQPLPLSLNPVPFTKSLFSRLRFSAVSEGGLSIRLDGTNLPEALPLPEKVANHIEGLRRQETPTCKGKKSYPAIAAVAYSSRGISSAAAPFLDIGCVQADEFVRGGCATDNELSQYQQQKERVDSQYTLQGGARIFLIARGHRGRMEDLPFLQNLDLRASSAYLE
jgi:hypothetical protein